MIKTFQFADQTDKSQNNEKKKNLKKIVLQNGQNKVFYIAKQNAR